jgi:hypothetical protein
MVMILCVALTAMWPLAGLAQEAPVPAAEGSWVAAVIRFLHTDAGVALLLALWGLSEALAMIPAVKSNSVFQLLWGILSRMKKPATAAVLLCVLAFGLTACGHTVEQLQKIAHDAIDTAGKIYQDVTENVDLIKKTVTPAAPVQTSAEPAGQ